jgi:hypothetical protein
MAGKVAILRLHTGNLAPGGWDLERGERVLKKWPFLALASLVIFGCAGSGNGLTGTTSTTGTTGTTGTTTTTGTTGTTGRTGVTVNLPDVPGLLDTYYLTAQGRVPGDLTAILEVVRYRTSAGDSAEQALLTPLSLVLTGVGVQSTPVNSDTGISQPSYPPSKTFDLLELAFDRFLREDDGGGLQSLPGLTVVLGNQEVTAYRGRVTALQLFLNDSMFPVDDAGNVSFNLAQFLQQNRNPETNRVRGFLSDYLSFDISAVPNRPQMPPFGTADGLEFQPQSPQAARVYFSGDSFAISDRDPRSADFLTNGINGVFVFLTPSSFVEGFFRPIDPTTRVKSYELKQRDPQNVLNPRLITALKGIYRDYTEVLGNFGDFNMISIPKSGDGRKQQLVAFRRTGTAISDMWFGEVEFLDTGNPFFRLYPIRNLYPASTAGEITGSFTRTELKQANGTAVDFTAANWWRNVRFGKYRFITLPTGVTATTGDVTVFRR